MIYSAKFIQKTFKYDDHSNNIHHKYDEKKDNKTLK